MEDTPPGPGDKPTMTRTPVHSIPMTVVPLPGDIIDVRQSGKFVRYTVLSIEHILDGDSKVHANTRWPHFVSIMVTRRPE